MNPIDIVITKLPDVREVSGRRMARCPAHEDGTASLSIGEGSDGRVLLHCFAGCKVDAICAAVGLSVKDLMPTGETLNRNFKPVIVAEYDYRDEAGELIFQAVRFEPKDFRQRRPIAGGGWDWKVSGVRIVPYRLPEILAADPAKLVFICEGEKDCDNLAKLGIVATTNAGGAGKWKPEHSAFLAGRNVVILPDNDEPGRKHAIKVRETLEGVARSCKIVSLPNLPEKGDVSDWLKGIDQSEGVQIAKEALWCAIKNCEVKEFESGDLEPEQPPTNPSGVRIITFGEAMKRYVDDLKKGGPNVISTGVSDLDDALGGGIAGGEMVVITGRPSHGKTMLALQIIHEVSERRRKCLLVSEETPAGTVAERSLMYSADIHRDEWELRTKELEEFVRLYRESHADNLIAEGCRDVDVAVDAIKKCVRDSGVGLVAVDYLQLLNGKGNGRYEKITQVSQSLRECANDLGVPLLVLCQLNRDVEDRDKFMPRNSDIKDSGQIEQDAAVIIHCMWPHLLDSNMPSSEYWLVIGKNKNRGIRKQVVKFHFRPSRMRIETEVTHKKNYEPTFQEGGF
jgi:5S rRNA maturation endonuclease (ribonuclease M5)